MGKSNIIKIIGGLGNQMLQYALYISMREKKIPCKMDISNLYKHLKGFNRDSIFNCFNVENNFASIEEISEIGDVSSCFFNRIKRKVFGKKSSHYTQKYSREYLPEIYSFRGKYLDGYWFNVKYFIDYISILRKDFSLKNPINDINLSVKNEILNCNNSVGIHVRLGDVINSKNFKRFGNICTYDYYSEAISIIENKLGRCNYFVFTNDESKCKEMFPDSKFKIINNNDEFNGHVDLYLMSLCKHNIIANSTFSFWSAILNCNDNIVIAPKVFSNSINVNDNCPTDWIRI